jgi:hypothetical protein
MRSIRAITSRAVTPVLALFCGGALADWTAVGRANEIYAAYADTASIRRAGSVVTMHGLYDFRRQDYTPEGRGLFSTAVLREYDCEARRVRLMSSVDFAGHMGAGSPVSTSSSPRRWEAVVEGGIDDAFLQFACKGNSQP